MTREECMKNITDNFNELKQRVNISITKLSREMGVSDTVLYKIEKGGKLPEITTLIKISKYFNVPIDLLVGNAHA